MESNGSTGKMNPLASQFSPPNIAMVQYGSAVKANASEDRPQDLIVQEVIKQLVQEMQEAKLRTRRLEEDNHGVKVENEHLKRQLQSLTEQIAGAHLASADGSNLTGYAAPEASSTAVDLAASSTDTTSIEKKVSDHQNTVTEILEKFNEHLAAETSKREELIKQVNESQYALKNVKGRTGVLESKFKTIAGDMDELETTVQSIRNENGFMADTTNTSNTGLSIWINDKIDKLEASVKIVQADVDTHRVLLNEFGQEDRNKSITGGIQSGWNIRPSSPPRFGKPVRAPPLAGESSAPAEDSKLGKDDKLKVVAQLKTLRTHFYQYKEMYRQIDNCATRDGLYLLYHRYTADMDDATGEELDELWDMRDWVIVRLALFDLYGKALKEAKSADIGL